MPRYVTFRYSECTCRVIGFNGDPDQYIKLDRNCPEHGEDPDQAYENYRDRRNEDRHEDQD